MTDSDGQKIYLTKHYSIFGYTEKPKKKNQKKSFQKEKRNKLI